MSNHNVNQVALLGFTLRSEWKQAKVTILSLKCLLFYSYRGYNVIGACDENKDGTTSQSVLPSVPWNNPQQEWARILEQSRWWWWWWWWWGWWWWSWRHDIFSQVSSLLFEKDLNIVKYLRKKDDLILALTVFMQMNCKYNFYLNVFPSSKFYFGLVVSNICMCLMSKVVLI